MPDIEVTTRPAAVNGAPGAQSERPRVELILSPETGATTVKADGGKTVSRADSIAKIRAQVEGKGGGKAAAKANDAGSGSEGDDEDAGGGEESGDEDAGDDVESEEGDAETTDDGEEAGETSDEDAADEDAEEGDEEASDDEEEAPAPAAKKAATSDEVDLAAEVERAGLERELDHLRGRLESYEAGLMGDDAREAYFEDPAGYLRTHISSLFGLSADDPDLKTELTHLLTDLTVAISNGSISAEKIAQLENERVSRAWKLGKKARKATKKADGDREERTRAENYVDTAVVKPVAAKFPFLELARELDGISPGKAVLDMAKRAVAKGIIKAEGKSEADILTEAIRLTNHSYKTRAEKIAARVNPAKAPAAAQGASAVAAKKIGAPKTDPSAAKKKPRNLSAAEAAQAATTKPGAKQSKKEGPKEIIVVRDADAESDRRRAIFEKHRKSRTKP